jgi:hypothetical protein
MAKLSTTNILALKKEAQEQYLATAFLLSANRGRYGRLIEDLERDYLQGQDRYPKTITAAFGLLTNWKQNTTESIEGPNDGVSFHNNTDENEDGEEPDMALATDGQRKSNYKGKNYDKSKVSYHRCGKKGHYAPECDQEHQECQTGKQLLTAGVANGEFDQDYHVTFQFHQRNVGTTTHPDVALKMSENGRVPKRPQDLDPTGQPVNGLCVS